MFQIKKHKLSHNNLSIIQVIFQFIVNFVSDFFDIIMILGINLIQKFEKNLSFKKIKKRKV